MEQIEIERRFILKRLPKYTQTKGTFKVALIKQYYKESELGVIRYRETKDTLENFNVPKYEKIIKTKIEKGINKEQHFDVDQISFFNEIQKPGKTKYIKKTRITVEENNLKFEIDRFEDYNLIILEVELESLKQKITFPYYIEKEIIKEITGEKEFSNYNLSE